MIKSTTMFCSKLVKGDKTFYLHFGLHHKYVEYHDVDPKDVLEVVVIECEEYPGCYWGWWDSQKNKFEFVFYAKGLVTMCFPYDINIYIQKGEGLLLPVRLEFKKENDEK